MLSLPGISGSNTITADSATTAPLQVLADYLGDLGATAYDTVSGLVTANYNYLNPTGTSYTVSGSVSGAFDYYYLTGSSAPGGDR